MQLKLKALKDYTRTEHGGTLRQGKRKLARPIATKTPMHLVLRSSKARGQWSLLRQPHFAHIQRIVYAFAKKNDVRIYQFANAGNHLHLLVQPKTRRGFRAFLRTITGLIARLVTGAVKGSASGPFWDSLAFTRVIAWGRDFKKTAAYVFQNALEGFGLPTKRKPALRKDAIIIGFT